MRIRKRTIGKIMGDAKISESCAYFLSIIRKYPGHIQSGGFVDQKGDQILNLSRPYYMYDECAKRKFYKVKIVRKRANGRATLSLHHPDFIFYETPSGMTKLILIGYQLPETVTTGLPRSIKRLSEIFDVSLWRGHFFVKADPLVVSIKNVRKKISIRQGIGRPMQSKVCKCLEVRLDDDWSVQNWGYWEEDLGFHLIDEVK